MYDFLLRIIFFLGFRKIRRKFGKFYTAQVNMDGSWVNKSFFPSEWSPKYLNKVVEQVYDKSDLLAKYGGRYSIYQGILENDINIRFIIDDLESEMKVFYPLFDIVIHEVKKDSAFRRSMQYVNRFFMPKAQGIAMSDAMKERIKKQLIEDFRKIIVRNEMDRSIELTFSLMYEGKEHAIQHYIGAHGSGQVPYLIPGILSVTHEISSASVDITDTKNEYIFTIQSDGSVTQLTQKNPEFN